MTYVLAEINFVKVDDEGNEEIDSNGNIKTFVPKGRWKELEYLCEDRNDEDFERTINAEIDKLLGKETEDTRLYAGYSFLYSTLIYGLGIRR